jgi:uncharacterized membrane protein YfcA
MPLDWTFYLVAVPAVILVGLSKGGFSGLSALAMPLLSLSLSPVRAAAIMLPILIVQDWVSVWAFRRDFDPRNLIILIPASLLGIGAGWLFAADVSEALIRLAVGVISIAFVAYMLLRSRGGARASTRPAVAPGLLWGRSPASPASSATPARRHFRSMSCRRACRCAFTRERRRCFSPPPTC